MDGTENFSKKKKVVIDPEKNGKLSVSRREWRVCAKRQEYYKTPHRAGKKERITGPQSYPMPPFSDHNSSHRYS